MKSIIFVLFLAVALVNVNAFRVKNKLQNFISSADQAGHNPFVTGQTDLSGLNMIGNRLQNFISSADQAGHNPFVTGQTDLSGLNMIGNRLQNFVSSAEQAGTNPFVAGRGASIPRIIGN